MRVMMIVKATDAGEAGALPTDAQWAAMGKYNEELQKAGVLLDVSGLQPSSAGVRVRFSRGKPTVIDGPFTESKELIAGYWMIQVGSKEEAIEWAKRIPAEVCELAEVELRPLYELEDIAPPDVVEAAVNLGKTKVPGKAGGER